MSALNKTRNGIVRALTPSLSQQLEHAETELACAEMIGDFDRMKRETARWRERVAQIRAKMENPDEDC